MSSLFLIFNHRITPLQKDDARNSLGIRRIIPLPPELQEIWGNIPPDMPDIAEYIRPIREWLISEARENDFVLIQGDFGACYLMVCFALEHGVIPVYSTNRRMACEEHQQEGTVKLVHYFRHEIFRVYGR